MNSTAPNLAAKGYLMSRESTEEVDGGQFSFDAKAAANKGGIGNTGLKFGSRNNALFSEERKGRTTTEITITG